MKKGKEPGVRSSTVMLWLVAAAGAVAADEGVTVLSSGSRWRQHFTWGTPLLMARDGVMTNEGVNIEGRCACAKGGVRFDSPPPPPDWRAADFDDSAWSRLPGNATGNWPAGWICGGGPNGHAPGYLSLLCLRGKFEVKRPAAGFRVSVGYNGGVVVYLNGTEVARGDMPEGRIDVITPAAAYATNYYARKAAAPSRKIENCALPPGLLKPGVNILALEVHRAPLDSEPFRKGGLDNSPGWFTAGIKDVTLVAPTGDAVPNVGCPAGIRVWNAGMAETVATNLWSDPTEPLRPMTIVGARGGTFSGQVVVGVPDEAASVSVSISDMVGKGVGRIPGAAVQVRYPSMAAGMMRDALLPAPAGGVKVQPVWVTVAVPADARPGEYAGQLSVSAGGVKTAVPVVLSVSAWRLPEPKDFFTYANFYQSPDSVAEQYKVPLWSDRHFELIGKSFKLIGGVGNKIVFVPLIARTNQGHSQSMVRWVRKQKSGVRSQESEGGAGVAQACNWDPAPDAYAQDFTVMEKYLDVVETNMGKPRVLVLNVWEIYEAAEAAFRGRKEGTGPVVTLFDPATGKTEDLIGPPCEAPESEAFWRPALEGVRERLKRRGWDDVMMLGQGGDREIPPLALALFRNIFPDCRWMRSSHHPGIEQSTGAATLKLKDGSRVPVGYQENAYVYGTAVCLVVPHDPSCQRAQAAAGPEWTVFPRANCMKMWNGSTPAKHRFIHECALAIGRPGISRLGADMWTIAGDKGARNGTPFCRYPASNLSQINLAYASILAPGPDGPMPTTRLEHVREGVQECEARVFIEKALAGGKLPADLARRAQATLDERTRVLRLLNLNETGMYLWYPGSGWQERTRRLYETAAETAVSMNVEP